MGKSMYTVAGADQLGAVRMEPSYHWWPHNMESGRQKVRLTLTLPKAKNA